MKRNLLDRAIEAVSPALAADRYKNRTRAKMWAAHYDGAGNTYRQKGWKAPSGDANASARGAGPILRRRSRDFVRNNAIASRAVDALVNNVIGDGIVPSVVSDDEGLEKAARELLVAHLDTTAIDAAGRQNLYGMQRLAFRSIVEGGECLMLERPRRVGDGLPLNFQIELLEPEFIDGNHVGELANGNVEVDGIEFDLLARRVAYRLYREHPEGTFVRAPESRRVMADHVIHAYRMDRSGQHRGVPWMAQVMSLLADAYDYADAQLLRQKIAAMFVAFTYDSVADGADINLPGGTDADQVDQLVPGMFEHLPPGRQVEFSNPPKAEGYGEHMSSILHMIAGALGLTYEALSMQLGEVNFSSARMGRIEMNRAMSSHQGALFIPQVCQPMEIWLRKYLKDHLGPRENYKIKWTPPRFEMVDPAREVAPMLEMIEGELTSRHRTIRSLGHDPDEIDEEIAKDKAKAATGGSEQ